MLAPDYVRFSRIVERQTQLHMRRAMQQLIVDFKITDCGCNQSYDTVPHAAEEIDRGQN